MITPPCLTHYRIKMMVERNPYSASLSPAGPSVPAPVRGAVTQSLDDGGLHTKKIILSPVVRQSRWYIGGLAAPASSSTLCYLGRSREVDLPQPSLVDLVDDLHQLLTALGLLLCSKQVALLHVGRGEIG